MKKFYRIILVVILSILVTGCVKFNLNMDIKKDKSMDFSLIYAANKAFLENEEIVSEEERQNLINSGFSVENYDDGTMKGITVYRNISNIDLVSSAEDTEYRLSGILDPVLANSNIFKVKKGFIKNTYIAKFIFDSEDSTLNGSTSTFETEETITTDDSIYEDNSFNVEEDDFSSTIESDEEISDDYNDLMDSMNSMDLSFKVSLPYGALSHNAKTVNNDGKNLEWSLMSDEAETIEFTFELYNMTNIYISAAVIGLVILLLVSKIVVSGKKKNKTLPSQNSNVNNTIINNDQQFNPVNNNQMSENAFNYNSPVSPQSGVIPTQDTNIQNVSQNNDQTIQQQPTISPFEFSSKEPVINESVPIENAFKTNNEKVNESNIAVFDIEKDFTQEINLNDVNSASMPNNTEPNIFPNENHN